MKRPIELNRSLSYKKKIHGATGLGLLVGIIVTLCVVLCGWQILRGYNKSSIYSKENNSQKFVDLNHFLDSRFNDSSPSWLDLFPISDADLTVRGIFLPKLVVLQNRTHHVGAHNRVGFEVYQLLKLSSASHKTDLNAKHMLVKLGWYPRVSEPVELPPKKFFSNLEQQFGHVVSINGRLKETTSRVWGPKDPPIEKQFMSAGNSGKIWFSNQLSINEIGQITNSRLLPTVFELQSSRSDGLQRQWKMAYLTPMKHYAYALQWFLLACLIAWFGLKSEALTIKKF